jgi:hypothetical protein
MNSDAVRKADIKPKLALFALSFLIIYLSIQFHEALHWVVANLLGLKATLVTSSSISTAATTSINQILLSAAGTFSTIMYVAVGLLMFRSDRPGVRKFGFLLAFINSFGRVVYEFAAFFTGGSKPDETAIAMSLGIPDLYLRIPVTAACVLAGIYLFIRDKETSRKDPGWVIPICASIPAYTQVLLLDSCIKIQVKTGGNFFQPVLMGYPPFLVIVNLLQLSALCLLLRRRTSSSAAVLLAVAALNVGIAGAAAIRVSTFDRCEGTPRVTGISPASGGLEALNLAGQKITIRFDRAMDVRLPSIARDISFDDKKGMLDVTGVWAAPDTLELHLNRDVYPGEIIELKLDHLRDASGIEMCSPVRLEYE